MFLRIWVCCAGRCSADLTEPQTHLPSDADTEVMKAFHGTSLPFGEAQPKPKLWPFAAVDCGLLLCDFSSVFTLKRDEQSCFSTEPHYITTGCSFDLV